MQNKRKSVRNSLAQFKYVVLLIGCVSLCLSGCATSRLPSGMSSLLPNQGISGQYEPDVDYEAERQKMAAEAEAEAE